MTSGRGAPDERAAEGARRRALTVPAAEGRKPYNGPFLELAVEVKDKDRDDFSELVDFLSNLAPHPKTTAVVICASITDEVRAQCDAHAIRVFTLDEMTDLVQRWTAGKQTRAVREALASASCGRRTSVRQHRRAKRHWAPPASATLLDAQAGHKAKLRGTVRQLDATWQQLRPQLVKAGGATVAKSYDQHVTALKRGGAATAIQKQAVHGLGIVDQMEGVFLG